MKINLDECRYEQACIGNGEVEITYFIEETIVGRQIVANGTREGEKMGDVHSTIQFHYDTDELQIN